MANTFKFGNGNWAVKDDYVLAYNDENNNFKPLPFDFTRDTIGTYVDSDGLIKTAASGEARIDYLDNANGHLLLEPSRVNYITDSAAGIYINLPASTALKNAPDGTITASAPTPNASANRFQFSVNAGVFSTGDSITYSWYSKALNSLQEGAGNYQGYLFINAALNLTVGTTEKIESDIQGYNRYQHTFTVVDGSVSSTVRAYYGSIIGIGNEEVAYWGHQLEEGSYATSYIPTNGQSVTRAADDIALTFPDVDSFNSSNGFSVISKFGIGAAGTGTSSPFLEINDDTSSTFIGFGSTSTLLRCRINLNGTAYLNTQTNALRTQDNSLFISCDSSGWSQGANGTTNFTGSNDASVIDKLTNIAYYPSEVYGIIKIKELLIYNTRLTDAELETLTT